MADAQISPDATLDARELLCPMPVIKTAKAMKTLQPGQILKLVATDRGSVADIPAWAVSTGNELIEWHEDGGKFTYLIRKASET